MLPKRIEFLLFFFDVFGYNSGSSKLSRHQKTACFIYIAHVLLVVFFTFYKIRLIFELISLPIVELINPIIQYSASLYFYWFIIVDSVFYRREHQHFWKILEKFNKFYYSNRYKTTFKYFVLKLTTYFITTLLCLFVVTMIIGQLIDYLYVYIILMKTSEFRVFYYIFCLEALHNQMKIINCKFKRNKSKRFVLHLKEFRRIRDHYSCAYEITNCLNKVFGLSQVTAILYCFYVILADLNWMITHVDVLSSHLILAISKSLHSSFKI